MSLSRVEAEQKVYSYRVIFAAFECYEMLRRYIRFTAST